YGSALSAYDLRPRPYIRHYYWSHHDHDHDHDHDHAQKPPPFDPELYRPQLPTIIDPPLMNAYPSTGINDDYRHRPPANRLIHRRGRHPHGRYGSRAGP